MKVFYSYKTDSRPSQPRSQSLQTHSGEDRAEIGIHFHEPKGAQYARMGVRITSVREIFPPRHHHHRTTNPLNPTSNPSSPFFASASTVGLAAYTPAQHVSPSPAPANAHVTFRIGVLRSVPLSAPTTR